MFFIGIELIDSSNKLYFKKAIFCILKNIAKAHTISYSASVNFQYSGQRYGVRFENKLPKINSPLKLNASN